ncbi:hypothetical protein VSX64_22195 [Aurantimonas sp. C2-6-R+9]|uniref:hypothetical protein n=1 Tax=unclassified Aurantimonas TaxID=2638230 RepID=UPI002E190033|nr:MULTISPECIES: hypothetical protein [unclassified Aurantimonas]MEC5293166.1 hypothetical protein [Aurantimonas sp. C2-3-R2]MEC5383492.1 hypothetical protein [Aurantimonas sp. C2-6-R+9]MEC5414268.1 hypothetical protein [Aurantimonas sp. C2-4-R8]
MKDIKAILRLTYAEGLSVREVAERLDASGNWRILSRSDSLTLRCLEGRMSGMSRSLLKL